MIGLATCLGARIPHLAGGGTDPYIDFVRLLLRGQGANGSTTIQDTSPSAWGQSGVVNATISSEQSLPGFGGTSIKMTSGYVWYPPSVASDIGANPVTMEAWVRPAVSDGSYGVVSLRTATARGWAVQGNSLRAMIDGTWSDAQLVPSSVPAASDWSHVAVTHNGFGLYTYWLNGSAVATATFGTGSLDTVATSGVHVGSSTDGGENPFTGYMYLRLTVGVCRYTAPFTPPSNFPSV